MIQIKVSQSGDPLKTVLHTLDVGMCCQVTVPASIVNIDEKTVITQLMPLTITVVKHETTFDEVIAFLQKLKREERERNFCGERGM